MKYHLDTARRGRRANRIAAWVAIAVAALLSGAAAPQALAQGNRSDPAWWLQRGRDDAHQLDNRWFEADTLLLSMEVEAEITPAEEVGPLLDKVRALTIDPVDRPQRIPTYCKIARIFAKRGEHAAFTVCVNRASEDDFGNQPDSINAFDLLILRTRAAGGDWDGVRAAITAEPRALHRAGMLAYVAKEAAQAGDVERARQCAQRLQQEKKQAVPEAARKLTVWTAEANIAAGELSAAAEEALQIPDTDDAIQAYTDLAAAQFKAGDTKSEATTCELVAQLSNRLGYRLQYRAMAELALALAQAGDRQGCSHTCSRVISMEAVNETTLGSMLDVALAQAKVGETEAACATILRIDQSESIRADMKNHGMAVIAAAFADADQLDTARRAADTCFSTEERREADFHIGKAMVSTGRLDEVDAYAAELPGYADRAALYFGVAAGLIKQGPAHPATRP